jgi:hypothetical protein
MRSPYEPSEAEEKFVVCNWPESVPPGMLSPAKSRRMIPSDGLFWLQVKKNGRTANKGFKITADCLAWGEKWLVLCQ